MGDIKANSAESQTSSTETEKPLLGCAVGTAVINGDPEELLEPLHEEWEALKAE
jgi:hypothetical protein